METDCMIEKQDNKRIFRRWWIYNLGCCLWRFDGIVWKASETK